MASGLDSIAIGRAAQATVPRQIVLGAFSQEDTDAHLIVGGGTDFNKRSNLFKVMKNGRGVFRSTDYVEPTAETPSPNQPTTALTVEGNLEIKGKLKMQRYGDIGMGDFGRTEDRSAN